MPFKKSGEFRPILDEEQGEAGCQVCKKNRRCCCLLAFACTVLVVGLIVFGLVYIALEHDSNQPSSEGVFKHAAVAADSAQCSTVGKNILKQGGNAVDAAIASLLCSGLTSVQSMGLGGGFFMTIYNRTTGQSTIIDAREVAPEKATADMYHGNRSASASGPLSIAVPGEVKGYWLAHQKYGQLPWSDLFQPTIKMASEGFRVPIGLSKAIVDGEKLLSTEPSLKVIFINPKTKQLFREGETMTRPQLAETLKIIAKEGAAALYNGSLTDSLLKDLQDIGSIITQNDLLNYRVEERQPVEVTLTQGVKIISPPPPSSGAILSFILNILDGYNLTQASTTNESSKVLTYHRMIEAFKFAYAKRTDLGDELFVNVTELVKNLTSRAYADEIRHMITDNATHEYEYYGPTFYDRSTTGTCHLAVLDQHGNAVSVTSTINGRFGSERRGLRTGIIFNNEMDDFSSPNITNEYGLLPSPANFIVPGKRPLSSMCPTVLTDPSGAVTAVLGAAGGSKITTATSWVAAHILWLGQTLGEAIAAPRLHHQLLPPYISYEQGFQQTVVEDLQRLGHNVSQYPAGQSIVQGIVVTDLIHAVSDYRKGGVPDGF